MTNADGVAKWTLVYGGINWANYQDAAFEVHCGLARYEESEFTESTFVVVNLYQNVRMMLEALHDNRESPTLHLENPVYKDENRYRLGKLVGYVVPDFLSGPGVNIVNMITGGRYYHNFTCASIRDRVTSWMSVRAFGTRAMRKTPETFFCMNGIEHDDYAMWLLGPITHHFSGVYLAGMKENEDPRFIDPWWNQSWAAQGCRRLAGLYTKAQEYRLGMAVNYLLAALTAVVAALGVMAGAWTSIPAAFPYLALFFTQLPNFNEARGIKRDSEHSPAELMFETNDPDEMIWKIAPKHALANPSPVNPYARGTW